jgi:endogenous inhibitor of DNA gyrase (YacG/DUF329 family)
MSRSAGKPAAGRARRLCPICRRPADALYRPFCSKRCADIDLGRWLGEAYRIPAGSEHDDDDGREALEEPDSPD